jgi:hypothetical protein
MSLPTVPCRFQLTGFDVNDVRFGNKNFVGRGDSASGDHQSLILVNSAIYDNSLCSVTPITDSPKILDCQLVIFHH